MAYLKNFDQKIFIGVFYCFASFVMGCLIGSELKTKLDIIDFQESQELLENTTNN